MDRKIVIIEGDDTLPNRDLLRLGFEKLFRKIVKEGKQPKIATGGGKSNTIQAFKRAQRVGRNNPCLLIDMDGPPSTRDADAEAWKITSDKELVFYMVQEMESWFISQPELLNNYFGVKNKGRTVAEKLGKKHHQTISKPANQLLQATEDSHKGAYHKIRDGVELLQLLDAQALYEADSDFKQLIDFINA